MEPKAHPLVIKDAPYPSIRSGTLIIKTKAVAINPVDILIQAYAAMPTSYPAILGVEVAGEVAEVGEGAGRFQVGQRVVA